jgi:FkbM family methyltransferase
MLEEILKIIYDNLNTYVIIGAMDGISHDNFINNIKHKNLDLVIFVEPVGYYFEKLKINASVLNGNIYFENCAISNISEDVEIVSLNPKYKELYPKWYDGCSCVYENGNYLNQHINNIQDEHKMITKSKAYTISDVLKKYNIKKIDYLQIDTEGYDERILNSFDILSYGIKFLKFEKYFDELDKKIIKKIKKYGYIYFYDTNDIIFVERTFFENYIKTKYSKFL